MSLINRVLYQLERRGAQTAPSQTLIRAVPMRSELHWLKPVLIATAISLAIGAAVWLRPENPVPVVVLQEAPGKSVPAPVSAVVEELPEELLRPASKLSFELSEIPPEPELVHENIKAKPAAPVQHRPPAIAQSARPAPVERESPEAKVPKVNAATTGDLPLKQVSRTQQADAEYRKALLLQQQGHVPEALAGYEAALKLNAQLDAARIAMAALLMESKRNADAERVLQEGLRLRPTHIGFSMALARVQVEGGKIDQALETLQKNLLLANDKADYQAFYAALLQREGRHKEAVNHYQIAVRLVPDSGIWLMGYGISLQAVQRIDDAKAAYQQALATRTLSPELTAFVLQKLKGF